MNGGKRVVMAGTCAEYDWRYGYCSENITPLVPSSLYGTCKSALQNLLKEVLADDRVKQRLGKNIFSLRTS